MEKGQQVVNFEADLETGETNIKAPWGDTTFKSDDHAALIKHAHQQLTYFRDVQGNKSQHLADDIAGYEQILKSSNPNKNSDEFLKKKHAAMMSGKRFENNLEVIDAIKADGAWTE